jgi:hypothetical protein
MPRVGFEPTIPAFERANTVHALDCTATVIGIALHLSYIPYVCFFFSYFIILFLLIFNPLFHKNSSTIRRPRTPQEYAFSVLLSQTRVSFLGLFHFLSLLVSTPQLSCALCHLVSFPEHRLVHRSLHRQCFFS